MAHESTHCRNWGSCSSSKRHRMVEQPRTHSGRTIIMFYRRNGRTVTIGKNMLRDKMKLVNSSWSSFVWCEFNPNSISIKRLPVRESSTERVRNSLSSSVCLNIKIIKIGWLVNFLELLQKLKIFIQEIFGLIEFGGHFLPKLKSKITSRVLIGLI